MKIREIDRLEILSCESYLRAYQFNTNTAQHFFCVHCGIHTFHRPRLDPDRMSVNARTLDGFDLGSLPLSTFDGQNWEQSARADGWEPDADPSA